MPALADKIEAASARRTYAKRYLNSIAYNNASGDIIDLLAEVEDVLVKLGKYEELEKVYAAGGDTLANVAQLLRQIL